MARVAPPRLSAADLADFLVPETPEVRRTVRALRRVILKAAPTAAEAIKFHVLCYYRADAWLGSIGGNICMIEVWDVAARKGAAGVVLSFIHGAHVRDPHGLLRGSGKSKRFVPIAGVESAQSPRVAALVRAAAKLRPWD